MKPQRPNLLQRMKAAESAPVVRLEDVANLVVALRRGGLLALTGPEMADAAASLAKLEAICQKHLPNPQPGQQPQHPPANKPAEQPKG